MNVIREALVICIIILHGVESVTKTWIPNTNYDNPSNWDLGRVPSYNDRVIFPSEMESAVQLRDGATTVRELVLPSNGEILLPFTGSLVVTGKSRPESEDVVFTRSWAAAWLDPDNWLTEGRRASRAVPHLERIPCTHDRILFPEGSSFRVRLPEVVVTVGTISLLGQELSPGQWQEALLSEPGERQFVSGGDAERIDTVVLTGDADCHDKIGCSCAGHSELQDAVCSHTKHRHGECYDSSSMPCVSPVQPLGHCCSICGAYLLLEYSKSDVNLAGLQSLLDSLLSYDKYSKVMGHMGKPALVEDVPRRRLQVVLGEVGDYQGDSVDLANVFADKVRNNEKFGIGDVTLYVAGEAVALSTWGSVLGTIFGTFIGALIVMGLIYLVFVVYQQKGWILQGQSFVFARFENSPSESEEVVETHVEVSSGSVKQQDKPGSSRTEVAAFDNPMYGNTKVAQSTTLPPAQPGQQATRENPVYSELKRREEKEKEDVEEDTAPSEETQEEEAPDA